MPSEVDRLIAALTRPAGDSSDFDLNPPPGLQDGRVLRDAAVLVALLPSDSGVTVILTKRASHLKHHPGQIAFPGGKIEASDASPTAAALREAQEEIGLAPESVQVLGLLPPHETGTGFTIIPVLGLVRGSFDPMCDASEVEEVFTVPLAHLMTPAHYAVEGRVWRGQFRRYYTVPWGPYYIWGATARILRGLADRVAP